MGWERRARGGTYYTRSRKVSGRVVREYVGTGAVADQAAALDAARRAERVAERQAWEAERSRLAALSEEVAVFDRLVEALTRTALLAAGYHRHHRGAWRKRRREQEVDAAPPGSHDR